MGYSTDGREQQMPSSDQLTNIFVPLPLLAHSPTLWSWKPPVFDYHIHDICSAFTLPQLALALVFHPLRHERESIDNAA